MGDGDQTSTVPVKDIAQVSQIGKFVQVMCIDQEVGERGFDVMTQRPVSTKGQLQV